MSNGNGTGFPWLNSPLIWDPTFEASPFPPLNESFPGYTPGGGAELAPSSGGWANSLGIISTFINQTFPNVWATIKGKPVTLAGGTAQPKASPTFSQQVPQLLLVAGVAVLGVALALMLFKK